VSVGFQIEILTVRFGVLDSVVLSALEPKIFALEVFMTANKFSNCEKNPCYIQKVIECCQAVDELVTLDPGSGSLEVLERLRLKMNDRLMLFDYPGAVKVMNYILLRRQGNNDEAELLETLGL